MLANTRFVDLSPAGARACLLALVALIVWGLACNGAPAPVPEAQGDGDVAFYRAVNARIQAGEAYYEAVAAELGARNHAMRPFLTFRLPTLALFLGSPSGQAFGGIALLLLALTTLLAWLRRLVDIPLPVLVLTGCSIGSLAVFGFVDASGSPAVVFHKIWASLLIALSLAVRSDRIWLPSVALAVVAVLIRELALVYLVVMAAMATWEGRRNEALGWTAAITIFAIAFGIHAALATAQAQGAGPAVGWASAGGWAFVLSTARWSLVLMPLPDWTAAVLVPLALLGLAGWRGGLGSRIALLVAAYIGAFLIVGRPGNHYWGLMYGQFLAFGFLFCVPSLVDVLARAFPGLLAALTTRWTVLRP